MKRSDKGLSPEQALREAAASLRLKGLDPSGLVYEAVKAPLIAGEITTDQAIAELMKESRKPKFGRSFAGFPVFPKSGHRITTEMAREVENQMDIEESQRLNPPK